APEQTGSGLLIFIRDRVFSFAMVLAVGFLLGLSLAATALFQALGSDMGLYLPAPVLATGTFILPFSVKAFLFALVYRVIPDVRVHWKDVAFGAILTAVLFE